MIPTLYPYFARLMAGDFKFALLGGLLALAGWRIGHLFHNRALRICAAVLLACAGIVAAHWVGEMITAWWVMPLAPHMNIIK